jgi:hypothetical protein
MGYRSPNKPADGRNCRGSLSNCRMLHYSPFFSHQPMLGSQRLLWLKLAVLLHRPRYLHVHLHDRLHLFHDGWPQLPLTPWAFLVEFSLQTHHIVHHLLIVDVVAAPKVP